MKVKSNRLDRGFYMYQQEFEEKAIDVLRSGWYVLGKEVDSFEEEFADYIGANYCVGLASGLDALWLSFKILGIESGDEVLVQGNTYIASVMGITINGASPIFVEPDNYFGIDVDKIEEKINSRTKAILVVHLYGMPSGMDKIVELCKKYKLYLIEDCAQSHGACYKGKMTGIFGDIGCFSFYPSKNLGAFGDGGAVVMNDQSLAKEFKIFRNYGSEKRYYNKVVGTNSRLDEMQAGLLRIKLKHIKEIINERVTIAKRYTDCIENSQIVLPQLRPGTEAVWHQYVIRCDDRKKLIRYLTDKGIDTLIHYPIPPHLSEAYQYLGYEEGSFPLTERYAKTVLSIPMYNGITVDEQNYVIDALNSFVS